MRTTRFTCIASILSWAFASSASAAPALRVQVDQHGDFLQIGNTLGFECAPGTPAPVVGTLAANACAQPGNVNDSAPDLLWSTDAPALGQALASQVNTATEARSTAVLTIPPGASVTHAFLYWGAESPTGAADTLVTVDRIGAGAFTQPVTAIQSFAGQNDSYQSVADITTLVQLQGTGAYRVSGIDVIPFANTNNNNAFGGWSMIVFYERAADPLRNLAIFDGLDVVSNGNNQNVALGGFLVPNAGFTGKLGIITYEGDNAINGDQLFFNGGAPLSNAQNPADNFFNGTRSDFGSPVSVVGDLPQLTGTAQSMAGIDLDIVDVTSKLAAGQTSATVQATSTGDVYYLGAFITSISTFKPDYSTSTKTAVDLNGGSLLSGDVLRYTVSVVNSGNDASVATVLADLLPPGVTYVPGSIQITTGANAGAKTDASGDDQGEYVPATNTVTVRLGAGANGAAGGSIPIGGTATVRFDVTVNAGFTGSIANQATVSAAGLLGAPSTTTPTDGNGASGGSPPTTVIVDQCATNANCTALTPTCETAVSPHVCVGCLVDLDCGAATSATVCDTATLTCVPGCRGTGGNGCDPVSALDVCTSTDAAIGSCVDCLVDGHCGGPKSATVCNAATSTCGPGCRGIGGNGCMANLVCTSTDAAIGQCIGCLVDGDCGGVTSGQVCDATLQMCVAGCRATAGNGCDPNSVTDVCTSSDAMIGQCVDCTKDGDCGGPTSAKVCDVASDGCIDGCRGLGANGCDPKAATDVCTSTDATVGQCVDCITDSDCGDANSGRVCDASNHVCTEGCRVSGGNGCLAGLDCTSTDATIGQCVMASSTGSGAGGAGGAAGGGGAPSNALVAEGGGLCTVMPSGDGRGRGRWLVTAAALGMFLRRRRHRVGQGGVHGTE